MRVFLAGATGVLGIRIVPLLVEEGHSVAGLTRSQEKASVLTDLGATPVVGDVFDLETMVRSVGEFEPDLMMSQLTDLPDNLDVIGDFTAANARIRREGVSNLLEVCRQVGIDRIFAQSVAWTLSGDGGRAVDDMERAVIDAGGTILRYGQLYGPGTYHPDAPPTPPRIHVDEAARRTVMALDAEPGVVELVESSA